MRRTLAAFAIGLVTVGMAWAVPTFSPMLDGIKDAGWGSTPDEATTTLKEPTSFNLNDGLYVTDDPTFIYFGFIGTPDAWEDGKSVHCHIDIDVGSTATGGIGDPWGSQVHYAFPYQPEYDVITQWNTGSQNLGWTGLLTWGGSSWSEAQMPPSQIAGGNGWGEIAVRRSSIGDPPQGTVLHLSMWLRPAWDTPNANACLPAEETFPSDNGGGAGGTFHNQFAYTLQTVPGDTSHPHLMSVHQIDKRSVELVFDEPMDQATLNVIGNYTAVNWITTGLRYVSSTNCALLTPTDFTPGSPFGISLGAGIHDFGGNSIDPAFDSLGWNGVAYTPVTFTVIDLPGLQDTIYMKGSFNFYHEYDGGWSGGNVLMYDDGTHGDPVANDHQFTLAYYLVSNGGTPNFEWGFVDEHNAWLPTGNTSFSVPDLTPVVTSYTIPNPTTQDVAVTINCDMQFINAQIMYTAVSGTMNGWGNPGAAMADPEADKLWTYTVTIPAGSARHQEFKFQRVDSVISVDWEWISNRVFEVDDSQPTQLLPTYYFNDYLPAPSVTAYHDGASGLNLNWNNWPRVHFTILSGDDPDNITTIVTTVTGSTYNVPAPLTTKKFYTVKISE